MNQYLIAKINEYLHKHYRWQHSLKYSEVVKEYNYIVDPYYVMGGNDNHAVEGYEINFDDFDYDYHLDGHIDGITSYDNVLATLALHYYRVDSIRKLNARYQSRDFHNIDDYDFSIMRLGKAVGMLPANYYYTYSDRESLSRVI